MQQVFSKGAFGNRLIVILRYFVLVLLELGWDPSGPCSLCNFNDIRLHIGCSFFYVFRSVTQQIIIVYPLSKINPFTYLMLTLTGCGGGIGGATW